MQASGVKVGCQWLRLRPRRLIPVVLAVGRALGRLNVERAMAIGFFVAFGTLWFAVSLLVAHIGDWSTLARHYPNMVLPTLRNFYMSSGYVGSVSYRSCLVLRVCETGIRLSVCFRFASVIHRFSFLGRSFTISLRIARGFIRSCTPSWAGRWLEQLAFPFAFVSTCRRRDRPDRLGSVLTWHLLGSENVSCAMPEPARAPESPIRSETNGCVLGGDPVTLVVRHQGFPNP